MKKEWKKKWLKALRSGDYEQGTGCLAMVVFGNYLTAVLRKSMKKKRNELQNSWTMQLNSERSAMNNKAIGDRDD